MRDRTDMAEGEGVGRDGAEMRCPRGRLVGFLGEVTTLHDWRRGDGERGGAPSGIAQVEQWRRRGN